MKRRIHELLICVLFFLSALTAYIFLYPTDNSALKLASVEDTDYVYNMSDGAETVGEGIEVISVPKSAYRGSETSAIFKGKAYTEYQIRVYYSSGLSGSKSFAPVVSDGEGNFSWEWRISSNARAGDVRIIVTGGDCRVSFVMEIL